MRKEFKFWIKSYLQPKLTDENLDRLNKLLSKFSNEDYENVSDALTSSLEDFLISCGVPKLEAVRYSWKWSD